MRKARFEVPEDKRAQKNVSASTLTVGDWRYRTKDGVLYLMIIDAVDEGVHDGTTEVFLHSGGVVPL